MAPKKNTTSAPRKAGALIGIPVIDHVIIGGDRHESLAELGVMPGAFA